MLGTQLSRPRLHPHSSLHSRAHRMLEQKCVVVVVVLVVMVVVVMVVVVVVVIVLEMAAHSRSEIAVGATVSTSVALHTVSS